MSERHYSQDELFDFIYDLPSELDRPQIQEHLRQCDECSALVRNLSRERKLLESALNQVAVPAELSNALSSTLVPQKSVVKYVKLLVYATVILLTFCMFSLAILNAHKRIGQLKNEMARLKLNLELQTNRVKTLEASIYKRELNIITVALSKEQRQLLSMPEDAGVLIVNVSNRAILSDYLKYGDVVLKVDDVVVGNPEEFIRMLQDKVGLEAKLTVHRGQKIEDLTVRIF